MELKDIKKIIENGGATLNKELKKASLTKGYMVSIEGTESQVQCNDYNAIKKTIEEKQEIIKDSNELFIGLWLDNNIMYVDISIDILDKAEALEFGKKNKQIAIFDLVKCESLYLKDYSFIKYYILYEVKRDKEGKIKDFEVVEQRKNLKLFKSIKASAKTLLNATYNNLDCISNVSRLIENKYIIIKDYEVIL